LDVCYFCRKRVYVMERLSAEGKFFHRSCFKCEYCATTLRLSCYAYDIEDGKRNYLSSSSYTKNTLSLYLGPQDLSPGFTLQILVGEEQ
uniref:LIM zinc-binding domain-containing protein n=1 Tax=Chelonoidis abingdonii TaxID=106734 RepID=A0A8C0GMC6_CHEAB